MRKTLNFSVVLKIPLTTGPRMNCLFFLECMSIQCCKSKARLSSRGIQNNENSMKPAPSAGKCTWLCEIKLPEKLLCTTGVAKLWCYPELLLTPSLTVSITEIYTDIRQCKVHYYALFRILSSKGAFDIFLSVKISITGPSSSDLLVTADEEHSIQQC